MFNKFRKDLFWPKSINDAMLIKGIRGTMTMKRSYKPLTAYDAIVVTTSFIWMPQKWCNYQFFKKRLLNDPILEAAVNGICYGFQILYLNVVFVSRNIKCPFFTRIFKSLSTIGLSQLDGYCQCLMTIILFRIRSVMWFCQQIVPKALHGKRVVTSRP